jgi:uncharacterized membrane protein YecN with MAPEG domain
MLFNHQVGDNITSPRIKTSNGVEDRLQEWRKVGGLRTYLSYLICQVEPDVHTMINKSCITHKI